MKVELWFWSDESGGMVLKWWKWSGDGENGESGYDFEVLKVELRFWNDESDDEEKWWKENYYFEWIGAAESGVITVKLFKCSGNVMKWVVKVLEWSSDEMMKGMW